MLSTPSSTPAFTRVCDALAWGVLGLVAILAALTFRDYGLGWDDYTHAEYAALLLQGFASGFDNRSAFSFVNLYAYGGGFDVLAALAAKILPFDLWETRRLVGACVGLIGLAATWRTGRRLGGPLAGLIALILLATCPTYYGHMFFNPKDAPFAVTMVIALWGLVRVFAEYPRTTAVGIALLGIGMGLAVGARILGGLAGIYAFAGLALIVAAESREFGAAKAMQRAAGFVVALVPAMVLAYAVMALVWPWGVVDPLNPLHAAVYFSSFFEKPWRELFAGQLIEVPDMPRSYLPQLMALKLPEIFLLLGIAGILAAIVGFCRRSNGPQRRATLFVVVLAAIAPILITFVTRPAMYNGIRHFVFILPPLAVLGGYAGAALLAWLAPRWRFAAIGAAAVFLVGIALPVVEMVRLHPYEYTHFNHIAGGVKGAEGRYMRDYWGLSFKQAGSELVALLAARGEQPPAGQLHWKIAVCGPHRPAEVALGPKFDISWEPRGAQFALTLGEFYCRPLDAPVLLEIKRDGVVFARVYDIRGKDFPTLLTIPAPQ